MESVVAANRRKVTSKDLQRVNKDVIGCRNRKVPQNRGSEIIKNARKREEVVPNPAKKAKWVSKVLAKSSEVPEVLPERLA